MAAVDAPVRAQGLAGVVAGQTAVCSIELGGGHELAYRGYDVHELAERATFEEVARLLLYGELPNRDELAAYERAVAGHRFLPDAAKSMLRQFPVDASAMDVLRSVVSLLGVLDHDAGPEDDTAAIATRLIGVMPTALLFWHQLREGRYEPRVEGGNGSVAAATLRALLDREPDEQAERILSGSFILYAEHEFNASAFCARIVSSTGADTYSAIAAAIGALKGWRHGGANEAALRFIEPLSDPDEAEREVLNCLKRGERIMGFGHRLYRTGDPRARLMREWSREVARATGDSRLFEVSDRIEQVMAREKSLFANVDFWCASCWHGLGIPVELFTPLFVVARTSGWSAHVAEQRAERKLIRPKSHYVGPGYREVVPLHARG
jgi:2-methylcitrate synthase